MIAYPTKLTRVRIWRMLGHIARGASLDLAARLVGVSRQTVWRHCKRDPKLRRRIRQAKQRYLDRVEYRLVQWLLKDPPDWPTIRWFLERRRPELYGRSARGQKIEPIRLVMYYPDEGRKRPARTG